jgi:hypothetical protein
MNEPADLQLQAELATAEIEKVFERRAKEIGCFGIGYGVMLERHVTG